MTDAARFLLPWPPAKLNPNDHSHRFAKMGPAASYRDTCYYSACEQGALKVRSRLCGDAGIPVHVTFHPPKRYRRLDGDNRVAQIKNGLDGLALALKVDDSRFALSHEIGEAKPPFGVVVVDVEIPAPEARP